MTFPPANDDVAASAGAPAPVSAPVPAGAGAPTDADLPVTRAELAAFIDVMVTAPERTPEQVAELVRQAGEWGVNSCYVPSARLPQRAAQLPVGALVSYPLGVDSSLAKAFAAHLSIDHEAVAVCVATDVGAIAAGDWNSVMADIVTVREVAPRPVLMQVVLDAGYLMGLPDGAERLARCCQIAVAAGADAVVADMGRHSSVATQSPQGSGRELAVASQVGADRAVASSADPAVTQPAQAVLLQAVQTMAASVAGRVEIKAMGGVDSVEQAFALLSAGATQLGCTEQETAALLAAMPE